MTDAFRQYQQALKKRRNGIMSEVDGSAEFISVKPDFYADGRVLSEDALAVFQSFSTSHPPYGLIDKSGNALKSFSGSGKNLLIQLSQALRMTGHAAVELATPRVTKCPYSDVLGKRLGGTILPLADFDHDQNGIDTLRRMVAPGAELNAPLFVSLIHRLPGIQRLHGSTADPETFARESVSLLREPLAHPQQWAAPFVYSLGSLAEFFSPGFLNDELALLYTKVEKAPNGHERLAWAIPTEDFVLRQEHKVKSRTSDLASDTDSTGSVLYPIGTRLGDIAIDEPTIGCPGNQMAFAMWDRTVDVMVGEDLWDLAG